MKILGRAAVFMNYSCKFAAETIQCLNGKYHAIYSNNFRKHTHMERYANYQGFWSMFLSGILNLENQHASPTLSDMNLIRLNWVTSWKRNMLFTGLGRPYWGKLCLLSRVVLETEGTVFPNTDRPRSVNIIFIYFQLLFLEGRRNYYEKLEKSCFCHRLFLFLSCFCQ